MYMQSGNEASYNIRVKLSQRYIAHELMTADGQIFGPAAAAPAGPVPTPLHTLVKYWSGGRRVCRTFSYAPARGPALSAEGI